MNKPTTKVGIIDYGMGNLRSVANAFSSFGVEAEIMASPSELKTCSHILLPGVGAFGDGIANLESRGWIPEMEEQVLAKKKFFLGICLGMQLLATRGLEHGDHAGLNWISGKVVRLISNDPASRIPHIGWNDVQIRSKAGLFNSVSEPCIFYFVHSYVLLPDDQTNVTSVAHHGSEFVATVEQDNIWAAQFHPEKSQKCGLALLRNFANRGSADA